MTIRMFLATTAALFLLFSCTGRVDSGDHFSSFKQVRRHLDVVPPAYKPAPLWIWNDTITKKEIDLQLSGFSEMGFGGIFIEPGVGNGIACQALADSNLIDDVRRKARRFGLDLRNHAPWVYAGDIPGKDAPQYSAHLQHGRTSIVIPDDDSSMIMGRTLDPHWDLMLFHEISSIANQLGITRRMADPFKVQGGKLHFKDMKRLVDRGMANGINMPGGMPSLQTLTGNMKYLVDLSFSNHTFCSEKFHVMSDYIGRLSLLLSTGEQRNKTLVLIPGNASGWSSGADMAHGTANRMTDEFRTLLGLLDSEQIGYDLGNEAMIAAHGSVSNESFVVGQREYNYVVIPQLMLNVAGPTADLLEEYLVNGGVVIALCDPPQAIDGNATDRLKRWPVVYAEQWLTMSGCNDPRLIQYLYSTDLMFTEREGGELLHMRRELDDGQLLFFANNSSTETCSASLVASGADMAHIDLFSGTIEQYPCVITDEITTFSFTLHPAESILLFLGQHEIRGKSARTRRWNGDGVTLPATGMVATVRDENVLKLDYCRLLTENDTTEHTAFTLLQQRFFQSHSNPENREEADHSSGRNDPPPVNTGFALQYTFLTDAQCHSKDVRLVVERPDLFGVSLNGTPLQRLDGVWWLDRAFGVYSVEGLLLPGENVVELRGDIIPEHCAIQPVYLTGQFDVLPLDTGWLLAPAAQKQTGSWKELGLPFYGGRVTYSATFFMDDPGPARVRLDQWNGMVATVAVNGSDAGVILAPNRVLRLDGLLRRGSNTVSVTVTGTLNNLLRSFNSVVPQEMRAPEDLLNAPPEQPSGMQYDLEDYGLFDPFRVEVMR